MVKVLKALILAALLVPSASFASADCLVCHGAMEGRMEGRKGPVDVHVDADRFYGSVHGALQCADCHLTYGGEAHMLPGAQVPEDVAGLVPYTSLKAKLDPIALAACSRCHPEIYEQLKGSVHGQNVFEKKKPDGPLCIDCHGTPHYIVPKKEAESEVNRVKLLHACGKCHEDEKLIKEYGLDEHVIEKYKESFHGKKYLLGHTKVPICADCHGSHAITRWDAPGSTVSGEGKVETCGKCHKGATAKFAAAPAHKYIGKDNPIPYYGEKLLIGLLLSTFAFIISHVLLEAYSEIRDSVFRKKGGKHE